MAEEFNAVRKYFYGDFYPLVSYSLADDAWAVWQFDGDPHEWVSWQFDRPEIGCGLVQGIRLPASPQSTINIHPNVAHPDAISCFENAETGETREISGKDLVNAGFTFALPPRSGVDLVLSNERLIASCTQLTQAGMHRRHAG